MLNTLTGMEQVWNGHGTDTQRSVNFEILHSLVWNGEVRNGVRGLVPDLLIGVWIEMCVGPLGEVVWANSATT